MKKEIQKADKSELIDYPIDDLVEGWFFKIDEKSQGAYLVEGVDLWGRKISFEGVESEIENMLRNCKEKAIKINSEIDKKYK